jgi:hypothetical protein
MAWASNILISKNIKLLLLSEVLYLDDDDGALTGEFGLLLTNSLLFLLELQGRLNEDCLLLQQLPEIHL